MAKVFQAANLVNATAAELWGKNAPAVKSLTDLVSLGDMVFSSTTNKELFLNTLVDKIKRTVIRTLDNSVDLPNLLLDQDSYYGILQKINIRPMAAVNDNSWNVGDVSFTPSLYDIHKPDVSQKLFQNVSSFVIRLTVPEVLYRSAFDEGKMDEFIAGLFENVEKCLIEYINAMTHLVLCNLIAERIKEQRGVNLLDLYKQTFTSATITEDDAIYDKDFLRFAGMTIRNYIKYMQHSSVLYNDGTELRATQRDNMHVVMLTDFVSAYTTYYSADTFHQELAQMPLYSETMAWMSAGNTVPNFSDNSSINVVPASEAEEDIPTAVEASGIVAVLADRQALGVCLYDEWSATDHNGADRYTNYTFGVNRGNLNDLSENAVVFYIADPVTP